MKKNTLFAIVAMLMMSVSALAQSNSYNMVIEMANGTKINIGPNDVKNIYFNDGELVVSGENLEKLVQTTNENMKQTTKEMSDLNARIATIETMIDKLSNQSDVVSSDEIKKLQAQIDYLSDALKKTQDGSANAKDIEALAARLTNLEAQSGGVSSDEIKNIQAQIAVLKDVINVCVRKDDVADMMQKMDASDKNLSNMINVNAKDIMDLKNEIKNQSTQPGDASSEEIERLKSITDAMMNQINALQARMSALENKQ